MNSPEGAATPTAAATPAGFGAIAMIDDDLRPMTLHLVPDSERDAVLAVLADEEVLAELFVRGIEGHVVMEDPGAAIEALTDPARDNGVAFVKIGDVSARTQTLIDRRRMMRQVAASIRETGDREVVEFGPDDDLSEIGRFDLVFIDYYLDDAVADGSRAEQVASQVQEHKGEHSRQQIVLMSTVEGVRAMRSEFRRNAKIEAASFAFVSKMDLDEEWKVRAHLDMLARGMEHSAALGDYISAVKVSAENAAKALATAIDDLDIGDFAYIQRIALHADGHPLGDYLSWLLSSHLGALAFEGGLRAQQAVVDRMEFEDGPLSPAEPSVGVAALYHDALFARNLGPLGPHPRAGDDSPFADVPFVQLGDVFLTADKKRAVVVLSPDCDLAFSTHGRPPDRDLSVILLFGDPNSVTEAVAKDVDTSTEGMLDGSEVYRIDWRFSSFRTVRLGDLSTFLARDGFDVTNRDRLRPIYSLKLQHQLGNHLMRIGPPIMPPIARHAECKVVFQLGENLKEVKLDRAEAVVSHFKKKEVLRLTPALVSKLKSACAEVLDEMDQQLEALPDETEQEKKIRAAFVKKVDALRTQVAGSEVWQQLLRDHALPLDGKCERLRGCVYLARGREWTHPAQPAVILLVGQEVEGESSDRTADAPAAKSTEAGGSGPAAQGFVADALRETVEGIAEPRPTAAKAPRGKPERRVD